MKKTYLVFLIVLFVIIAVAYAFRYFPRNNQSDNKTSDAGKNCADSEECEGACLSENENSTFGICDDYKIRYGCYYQIDNGSSRSICVDPPPR